MRWLPGTDPLFGEIPDPATLATVNRQGFSGPLWSAGTRRQLTTGLPAEGGFALDGVSSIQPSFPRARPGLPSPAEFNLPALAPSPETGEVGARPLLAENSELRLEGEIRSRRVVSSTLLPAWTNLEVLNSSTIQILVDRSGGVLSATLLPPGSGLVSADQFALQRARSVRFEPVTGTGPDLQWGNLEFVWRTIPIAANTSSAAPSPP